MKTPATMQIGVSAVGEDVRSYLDRVTPAKRRRDAERLIELMGRATGETPRLWGSIIGFGQYHYKYASGREGDAPAAGFAPRKSATTIYLPDGTCRHDAALLTLDQHKAGVGCLYLTDLDTVDLTVLEAIVTESYRNVRNDIDTLSAHRGSPNQARDSSPRA